MPTPAGQMGLTASDREALLSSWIQPSSDSEAARQERAERMVRNAIEGHQPFVNTPISIYAKGSYANNTNVRLDSDVDIVVQCDACLYYDDVQGVVPSRALSPYSGDWTPARWRSEVESALTSYFGAEVDTDGNVAIFIPERAGSRPSTDVVPSFKYVQYWDAERSRHSEGSVVHPRAGVRIVNWPQQQLDNGKARNVATGRRYKSFVRALKNCENHLAASGVLTALPSYLMECLVWNATDPNLMKGTLDAGFQATLAGIWLGLEGDAHQKWLEPNGIKYLFHANQKWTRAEALALLRACWKLLYSQ